MHFDTREVWRLIRDLQYLRIAKPGGAKAYLRRMVRDAEELEPMLLQYPAVRYEPLDPHYVSLKYLGALSEPLIADLCDEFDQYGWRGVVAACWLAMLRPEASYRAHFVSAHGRVHPENKWFVEFLISELEGSEWREDPELQELARKLRASLARLALPRTLLRSYPDAERLSALGRERDLVALAYRRGGLRAARAAIDSTVHLKLDLSND